MAITSLQDLKTHLQWAIQIEHSTIPPYLYAFFSIEEEDSEAAGTIRGVVLEEMLHLAIACNLLNAVGGGAGADQPRLHPKISRSPSPPLAGTAA